jgi:hypothetical protein
MHLPELDIQLLAFRLDVCIPGESVQIFDLGGDWDGFIVER